MTSSMADSESGRPTGAKKYLTDDDGKPSSMRLLSAFSFAAAVGIAAAQVWGIGDGGGGSELVLYFLVAAFAPKAVQKFAERRPLS